MTFLQPAFLFLFLLGIVPLLLYLFRRKSKEVRVSTLVFFKTLAKEHQESAWLRRLKKWLSFALTIVLLVAAVLALARLVPGGGDRDRYRTIVVLLDRSASMGVEDGEGKSRLEAAKSLLADRLDAVPEETGVALVAYDNRPEIVQPRTLKRRELISRLGGIEVRPIPGQSDAAMEAALLLAGLEKPAAIWHFSDKLLSPGSADPGSADVPAGTAVPINSNDSGISQSVPSLPEGVALHQLNLALPEADNTGITAFRLRPVPLEHGQHEVYAQIARSAASAEGSTPVTLTASVGGIPTQVREFDLEPGERTGFTFRVSGARDQLLRLSLSSENDAFPRDDQILVPLPEPRPLVAAWIRPDDQEDPFTRFALASLQEEGRFELLRGSPEAWPLSEEVDAVIFENWLPEEWPEDLPALVINPPRPSGPVVAAALEHPVPYDSVRVASPDHPVLFRVASGRVAVTQTSVFQALGSLEPLWIAGKDPVLAAGEHRGNRLVVMGFSPGLSEQLPFTAAFPLLIGNALLWTVDADRGDLARVGQGSGLRATGEFAEMSGDYVTWREWRDGQVRERRLPLGSGGVVELDRIGVWRSEGGESGSSWMLSASESDIPVLSPGEEGDPGYFENGNGNRGGIRHFLLALIALALLAESFLFHRFSVY